MANETTLIGVLAGGIGFAFVLGLLATRLRLPPLVGYLLAGVVIGPFTPGYVADPELANQLAEVGVILLMFGVGLHFALPDLLSVRRLAIPGALGQTTVATALGAVVARLLGWPWDAAIVFGICLSVASTVVLLRALGDRGMVQSSDGRVAVGWLVVEDLVTVLVLVLLPALAHGTAGLGVTIALTLGKVALFVAITLVAGGRVVPWLLDHVARRGSRELFTLAILSVALGIAVGAASLFGVSAALGAFFAGMVVNRSPLSHEAAEGALPLQDAFSVLFFVAVGMLFDPRILIRAPLEVVAAVLIVMVGKSLVAFGIVRLLGQSRRTALLISASLSQIGELSFILAALAVDLHLLSMHGESLIVAAAMISIMLNPLMFWLADRLSLSRDGASGDACR